MGAVLVFDGFANVTIFPGSAPATYITDTAQLAIYVRGVDDNFEVTEELLTIIPMHGQITAQEIQLCD